MSTLIVEVCSVAEINIHNNADKLEIAKIKGWDVIVGKGTFKVGDPVVYLPPDSCVPQDLSDKLGITKYCSPWKDRVDEQGRPFLRIRAARLRGESSFGTVFPCPNPEWEVGKDVKDEFGVVKYEPKVHGGAGEASPMPAGFVNYTDIENIRNFPDAFPEGLECVITEKLHGTCGILGYMPDTTSAGDNSWTIMARSKSVRRKEFNEAGERSRYWEPMTESMISLLKHLSENETKRVCVYGELFGTGIQDMTYGCVNEHKFRIFDISLNGTYMDYDLVQATLANFPDLEHVPILYRGPFSIEKVKELTDGDTTLCDSSKVVGFKGREGVVVKPVIETQAKGLGRLILKSISALYLSRKDAKDEY